MTGVEDLRFPPIEVRLDRDGLLLPDEAAVRPFVTQPGGTDTGLVEESLNRNDTIQQVLVTDRAVDVQIVGLRKKLGSCSKYIETVRGVGYRFKD